MQKDYSSDGNPLTGFELAEHEGKYFPAQAIIEGNKIKVYTNQVKNPQYIRYGWRPFTRANLVNKDQLPASSFRDNIQ